MAQGPVSMHVFGIEEVDGMLYAGMSAAANMKPALELVAEGMMESIDLNFQAQGRRGGGSWKKLDPYTVERKMHEGELPLILIATSALRDSMTMRRDPNMDLKVTRSEVRLGSRLDYANVQDKGGGRSNLPARPFATFTEGDLREWTRICEQYLIDRMKVGRAE
jgi:phage gpG-like protein